jgi:2-dehydro-3-deoxyglucarate aldolase/4-hydroxy-2-oxoheptanedioate aldolase
MISSSLGANAKALSPMNSPASSFERPLKPRLQRRAALPLIWLALGSPALAEIAARSAPGAAVVIDLQHGLWERGAFEAAVGIAGSQTPVIARTADFSATAIGAALEAGVAAVMAPLVESVDDARALASASRYPPQGKRSGGGVRPLLAGIDAMRTANQQVAVGAMIETALGARNAEAICAAPGIDFIFIGTGDLQLSMPEASPVQLQACCARIRDVAHQNGLPCGLFTSDAAAARQAFADGYEIAVVANDIGLAARGFAQALQTAQP